MVSRGHDEHEVLWEYSLGKIEVYLAAVEANEADELVQLVRVRTDPKGILRDAKNVGKGVQQMTRQQARRLKALGKGGVRG